MTTKPHPSVSVAIAIFNEESVLPDLYRRLVAVLDDMPGGPHEIVLADDGSSDGSFEIMQALASIDPRVKIVRLSRNFGHQAALTAALDHTVGDVVVLMDGDLQDSPEAIERFVERYRQGYDVVYAVRVERQEGRIKRVCYAAFYRIISRLADIKLPEGAGDFGLLSRRAVQAIGSTTERNRYLRGLRTWVGFPQTGVEVRRAARHSGEPKYRFRTLLKLACDGIFSFSVKPLRAATLAGLATILGSLGYAGYSLAAKLFYDQSPPGFTALILAVTFLSGVQLLFLGVIGEYVGRVYEEVKRRPHYVVDRVIHDPSAAVDSPRTTPTAVGHADALADKAPAVVGANKTS